MAVTTVNTGINQEKGITYSVITDSSADWASVANDTYFYDLGDGLPHYKDGSGTVLEVFAAGGVSTSLYSADDTIGSGRVATLTDTLTFQGNGGLILNNSTINNNTALISLSKAMSNNSNRSTYIEGVEDDGGVGANYWKIYNQGSLNFNYDIGIGFYSNDLATTGTEYTRKGIKSVGNNEFYVEAGEVGINHFQLRSGGSNVTDNGYLKFIDYNGASTRIQFQRSGLNYINPDSRTGGNGSIVLMGNSLVGSELISLQGRTLVQGADTLSTSTAFEIYDGDTAPTKLWDFRNDGSLFGYKSKTNLIAQNSIGNNDAEYILRLRTAADSGNYAWFGNDGEIKLGAGVLDNSTGDRTTNIIWSNGSITRSGTGQYATLLGSNITANYSGEIVVGMGRYVTLSAARTVAIGRQVHALGEGAVSIGNAVSLSIYSQGLGSNISSSGIYNTMVGRNLNTSANYAGIWGYGIDNVNKLDNGTTNSLALGWNTTTPQHLFFQTGAYIGGSSAIGTEDISLQGNTLIDGTLDMNNNRVLNTIVNPTVQETTSTANLTINATNENTGVLTAQAVALTVANPTGTPVQGQKLVYRIKDNGTARAITWGANFRAIGVTLPTTTTANKLLYVGCIYNTTDSKWDVVAVKKEA